MDAGLGSGVADDADGLSRTFTRTCIRLSTLSTNRQTTQVPDAAITLDALETLEVHADFAAEIALDDVFPILNRVNDLGQLLFAEILRADGGVDFGLGQDIFRVAWADAVNVT